MITISQILKYLEISGKELSKKESKELNSIFAECDTEKNLENQNITNSKNKTGDGLLNFAEWGKFKGLLINKGFHYLSNFIKKTDEDYNLDNNTDKAKEDFDYFAPNLKLNDEKFTIEELKKAFPNSTIDESNPRGNRITRIDNPDGSFLEIKNKDVFEDVISYSTNGQDEIKLFYWLGKLTHKKEENKHRVIYYNDNGKIYKIINTDTTYHLDQEEEIVQETFYDPYTQGDRKINYQDNEIKSYTNYNTGERTEVLDNNKSRTVYDGHALSQLFSDGQKSLEDINKLSKEEKLEFLQNFDIKKFINNYPKNENLIKTLLDFQINLVEQFNGYTDDLKNLCTNLQNNLNHNNINGNEELLSSFNTHILDRIDSIKKTPKTEDIKEPNGKIDANFEQGYTGDCWLLSTIQTIAKHPSGLDKLNKKIKIKKEEENNKIVSITVNIQGKDYEILKNELYSANEYSTGDLDIRALEIAVNRFCIENGYKDITAGGNVAFGMEIFFGNSESIKQTYDIDRNSIDELMISPNFIDELNENKIGVLGNAYENRYAINADTGEKVAIFQGHAYSISSYDDNYIYIVNPHDSSVTLKIEKEKLHNTFMLGKMYEL